MASSPWRPPGAAASDWPALPAQEWSETLAALHLWTQVVGKIRLVCGPWINHSWGVTLYVTSRGLGTSLVPYGGRGFEIDFDFVEERLRVRSTTGEVAEVELGPMSVATFHARTLDAMARLGMPVKINPVPNEIPDAIPFPEDTRERHYDPDHARALWGALVQAQRVLMRFRAGYLGKVSPVHMFWGAFDLAVTRFSGRLAPEHPGGMPNFPDDVAREAYSHEVTSCGFWPGNAGAPTPIFYAYAYPTPEGFSAAHVEPDAALWLSELGEFALPYEAVRSSADPDATLLAFLESTHDAAASVAVWDRPMLECVAPAGPDWWFHRSA